MSENKDLILESRYIHTGNSGVTISVERDVQQPTRAILTIRNGAFGAFSTDMTIRGNEHDGMTATQLRDLALVFLESAELLDEIKDGKPVRYQWNDSPSIIGAKHRKRKTPERIRKFIQDSRVEKLKAQGEDPDLKGWPNDLMLDFEEEESENNRGCDTVASGPFTANMSPPEPIRKTQPLDQPTLVVLRLKHLVGKL